MKTITGYRGRRTVTNTLVSVAALWLLASSAEANGEASSIIVSPDWSRTEGVSKTIISIQVCAEPPMRRNSPIHNQLFAALRNLKADYARFQPWYPYPRLAVAELYPPKDDKTAWDFSLIDPLVEDFMDASEGRPVIFTFSTIPSWMLKTAKPDVIPDDPNEVTWTYGVNPHFSDFDSTVKLFAQYQARLAQWYTRGGFKDENGRWHGSKYHYTNIAYWGVLNEPAAEHALTPAQYTKMYDAVAAAVKQVVPSMKFVGLADENVWVNRSLPDVYPYFLDGRNHTDGASIDAISFHLYAVPDVDETPAIYGYTMFEDAKRLIASTSYIEVLRRKLSPETRTIVEEFGSMLPSPNTQAEVREHPIDASYWNISAAVWAYMYGNLVRMGIDMVHGAELIDYPDQAPSLSLTDWDTGKPNPRYSVVKLMHDNFGPGDKILSPDSQGFDGDAPPDHSYEVYSQGFITPAGVRKVLLVNKRNRPLAVTVVGATGGTQESVDQTYESSIVKHAILQDAIQLTGFEVAVISLPKS